MLSTTLNKLSLWFLHHRAFSGYIEPVMQQFKPAWRQGLYRAQVIDVTKTIGDFVHITLQPQPQWKVHQAGQHVEFTAELNGRLLTRIFTIASSPEQYAKHKIITLVIKCNELGRFTPLLADELSINSWINISAAQGDFTFNDSLINRDENKAKSSVENTTKPAVMVAGGSGITPMYSMLSEHLSATSAPVYLRYIAPENQHQFVESLELLAKKHSNFTVEFMTRAEHAAKPLTLSAEAQVYCCGPQGLMLDIETLSKNAGANFYQEHFSLAPIVTEDGVDVDVTVTLNGKAFTASNQQNLLTQLETQNAPVIRGCGIGVCHQCQCTKKSGLVKNLLTGDVSDSGEQIIQLCISQPLSDLEVSI
ncbi:flavin reductase family protein [Psychrosphaera saromensis]|uniref:FAD-binding FR-type domain-containing protein n=1 Tax=Psychrosphaera saromensis TaxID=716813 RepID=A0A2S7UVN9_9GAMM|nr:FAD-binding oxidoreductase [Psychrosphaera saromensis]PQJ54054.1 hypothetical protein BTO11_10600 [Psychrosphaera saromensis]